jgi:hypothetical protein
LIAFAADWPRPAARRATACQTVATLTVPDGTRGPHLWELLWLVVSSPDDQIDGIDSNRHCLDENLASLPLRDGNMLKLENIDITALVNLDHAHCRSG